MRRVFGVILAAALLFCPGLAAAQMHGGSGQHMMGAGQHMMGPGMMHNMDMMSGIMSDMHQMMQSGRMTPEQQQQMMQMMNQMGTMMQQMQSPAAPQMEQQQTRQLKEMQQRLQEMKGQVQKQQHKH